MNKKVTGCKDCPFLEIGLENNNICSVLNEGIKYIYTQKEYGYGSPDWCPLKQESITIEIII